MNPIICALFFVFFTQNLSGRNSSLCNPCLKRIKKLHSKPMSQKNKNSALRDQTDSIPNNNEQLVDTSKQKIKEWNFIVYMAANNNLHKYALKNFRQMLQVGSTPTCNILIQLDEYGEEEANRFYLEKNKAIIEKELEGEEAISGTPKSLFNFVQWAIETHPAKHQAIVIWNHGSGIKDPSIWGKIYKEHRDALFSFNEKTGMMQIDRNTLRSTIKRGIGFNDTYEQYIDNQQLKQCFERISKEVLAGKKVDIVLLDACHMAMVEIASKLKPFSNYMVASEELEPGSGYNYKKLLSPFLSQTFLPVEFAQHAVHAYAEEYDYQLADYTQSAISLEHFKKAEEKLSLFAQHLVSLMETHKDYVSFIKKIRRNEEETTEFCDWDYIDCLHFLTSISKKAFEKSKSNELQNMDRQSLLTLSTLANDARRELQDSILANASGINLPFAQGLSIYFPEKNIHKSYQKTSFASTNEWPQLIATYLKKKKK